MKKVKICGKEYDMDSSSLSIGSFKNYFGMNEDLGVVYGRTLKTMTELRELYKDETIDKKTKSIEASKYLGQLNYDATRMAYTFIKEVDHTFMSYESWARTLKNALKDIEWVSEVVGIASDVF